MGITQSLSVIAMIYIAGQMVANTGGEDRNGAKKAGVNRTGIAGDSFS